jgi:phosphonoacetate hydrolase
MRRRYFLFGSLAGAVRRAAAAPRRKVLVVLLDGFGPEYLAHSEMPNLKRMAASGFHRTVNGLLPSVTNVNNASLVTGTFPDEHGITTNFYYDLKTGNSAEMKSPDFLLRPTLLEKAAARGWKTALVSSKDKVKTLCSRGAMFAVSAEKPEPRYLEIAGPQESMYSAAVNYWSFRVARHLLKKEGVDLLYLSSTDYMMHTYPPESAQSLEHLHTLDRLLGEIADDHPALEIYLTADHGMNAKTRALDPVRLLRAAGVEAAAAPLISDNHKAHHQDLGGSYYVYLKSPAQMRKALAVLRGAPEVEDAYDGDQAASLFRLRRDRIGDLFVLARKDCVFGNLAELRTAVTVRTHGSRHEAQVPAVIHGRKAAAGQYAYNLDLTRQLEWESL